MKKKVPTKKVAKKTSQREPTARMIKAAKLAVENGGNVSKAMREAGYSEAASKNVKVKETKAWSDLMDEYMPEELVAQRHLELLNAKHLQHDTFAMGFRTEQDKRKAIEALQLEYKNARDEAPSDDDEDEDFDDEDAPKKKKKSKKKLKTKAQIQSEIADKIENAQETLTDPDLVEMLKDAGCIVKRIAHRLQCREVYYFVADNKARKDALDMVHKLRGKYAPEKHDLTTLGKELQITGMRVVIEK